MSLSDEDGEDRVILAGRSLLETVFSWTLKDVLNRDLHKGQLKKIPETFESADEYLGSFVKPLIEEAHADLCTSMTSMRRPLVCEVLSVKTSRGFKLPTELFYDLVLRQKQKDDKFKTYEPEVGDLVALTDVFPRSIDDFKRPGREYVIAYVKKASDGKISGRITVFSSKLIQTFGQKKLKDMINVVDDENMSGISEDISDDENVSHLSDDISDDEDVSDLSEEEDENVSSLPDEDIPHDENVSKLFVVHLMNMTTNIRIYRALNSDLEGGNMNVIKHVLQPDSKGENCSACDYKVMHSDEFSEMRSLVKSWDSNESQETAVLSSMSLKVCEDQNSVNLIWGPPGTGKTKTIGQLLFCLLKMKCRTLTCAPTNTAVLTVTERLFNKVLESLEYKTYGLGNILLFGNKKRMKIDKHHALLPVFLDHRAKMLRKCFSPSAGYRHNLRDMISLLEDPDEEYRSYLKQFNQVQTESEDGELCSNDHGEEKDNQNRRKKNRKKASVEAMKGNKRKKGKSRGKVNSKVKSKDRANANGNTETKLSPKEFMLKRFSYLCDSLEFCVENLYTHLPTSSISLEEVKEMVSATSLLRSLGTLLPLVSPIDYENLKQVFNDSSSEGSRDEVLVKIVNIRKECLAVLESLLLSFVDPLIKKIL